MKQHLQHRQACDPVRPKRIEYVNNDHRSNRQTFALLPYTIACVSLQVVQSKGAFDTLAPRSDGPGAAHPAGRASVD